MVTEEVLKCVQGLGRGQEYTSPQLEAKGTVTGRSVCIVVGGSPNRQLRLDCGTYVCMYFGFALCSPIVSSCYLGYMCGGRTMFVYPPMSVLATTLYCTGHTRVAIRHLVPVACM